ncbi:hypothetical protein Kpho02_57600 [Kitasatospora phosalacinea]|uniref:Uncharacterized protein n=1 Tax=Kitasatospora phosalacinea TaxID=2065 RepID=A0A9W6QEG0_9ACTN|nr:hypothetical protein [Kitasatospora phosalacinea]GLW73461.1 hypothetical protein Kpho02_57600 [Kitasatospora phosalacinea]
MDTPRHLIPIPAGPVGIAGRSRPRPVRSPHRAERSAPAEHSAQPVRSTEAAVPADVELYAVLGED